MTALTSEGNIEHYDYQTPIVTVLELKICCFSLTHCTTFTFIYLKHPVQKSPFSNRPYSYSRYWTGTSLEPRLPREFFSNAHDIYLFSSEICSRTLSVPRSSELHSRKTVRFSEHKLWADKYPSIFPRQMVAIVYFIYLPPSIHLL